MTDLPDAGAPAPMPTTPEAAQAEIGQIFNTPGYLDGSAPNQAALQARITALYSAKHGQPPEAAPPPPDERSVLERAADQAMAPVELAPATELAVGRFDYSNLPAPEQMAEMREVIGDAAGLAQSIGANSGDWAMGIEAANEIERQIAQGTDLEDFFARSQADLKREHGAAWQAKCESLTSWTRSKIGDEGIGFLIASGLGRHGGFLRVLFDLQARDQGRR